MASGRYASIVGCHVLATLAAERADQLALIGEVLAAIVKVDPIAVPRKRYIGGMTIEPRRREDMHTVNRHPLRLVDRGSVAVVDLVVVFDVERDRTPIVEHHRHARLGEVLDGAERAVLNAHAAFVLEEHDPVAGFERAAPALGGDRYVFAQFTSRAQPVARAHVEVMHGVVGVGEDDPAGVGMRQTVPVPAVDQIGAGLFTTDGRMHLPGVVIG